MPKGVPRAVARLIRTSARTIAKPGQVLSYENAYKLYDLLEAHRTDLERASADALYRSEHGKTRGVRETATDRLRGYRADLVGSDEALRRLSSTAGRAPVPSLAPKDAKPISFEEEEESEEYFLPEEGALEAFVGVDYTEAAGYHHRKGKTADVSFNAVLRWEDGQPITESDARMALMQFASSGTLPIGMACDTVSWAGWKGREREGSEADLANFRHILAHVGDHGVRVGLLKPERM